ncbi:hypothetical protein KCP77_01815 [Salmonella enterica subsp. enterica]|nr:hypothetical protein KCP77_01815 [Salmonella enterica subsp. enterica]
MMPLSRVVPLSKRNAPKRKYRYLTCLIPGLPLVGRGHHDVHRHSE